MITITLPNGTTWTSNGRAWLLDRAPVDYQGPHYIKATICWPPATT